jgi:hypothetical protein
MLLVNDALYYVCLSVECTKAPVGSYKASAQVIALSRMAFRRCNPTRGLKNYLTGYETISIPSYEHRTLRARSEQK